MSRERKLGYSVWIPIPNLDRNGRLLSHSSMKAWRRKTERLLQALFGGTTSIPAPGTNVVPDPESGNLRTLYEQHQIIVRSECTRREFLVKRKRIRAFAESMAKGLNQAAVIVLAAPADSFLVEIAYEKKDKRSVHRDRRRSATAKKRKTGQ